MKMMHNLNSNKLKNHKNLLRKDRKIHKRNQVVNKLHNNKKCILLINLLKKYLMKTSRIDNLKMSSKMNILNKEISNKLSKLMKMVIQLLFKQIVVKNHNLKKKQVDRNSQNNLNNQIRFNKREKKLNNLNMNNNN